MNWIRFFDRPKLLLTLAFAIVIYVASSHIADPRADVLILFLFLGSALLLFAMTSSMADAFTRELSLPRAFSVPFVFVFWGTGGLIVALASLLSRQLGHVVILVLFCALILNFVLRRRVPVSLFESPGGALQLVVIAIGVVFLTLAWGGFYSWRFGNPGDGPTGFIVNRLALNASPDYMIQMLWSTLLDSGAPFAKLSGDFHKTTIMDRPPLLAGMALIFRPMATEATFFYLFMANAILAQLSWVSLLWLRLTMGLATPVRKIVVVLVCALSPVLFFNTVFPWPKLYGGFLLALASVIVLAYELTPRRIVFVFLLIMLAYFAHGSNVIIALPLFLLTARRFEFRLLLPLVTGLLILIVPSVCYMKLKAEVEPGYPGLLRFLATDVKNEALYFNSNKSISSAISESYREKSWGDLVAMKIENFKAFAIRPTDRIVLQSPDALNLIAFKTIFLESVVPALGGLWFGLVALLRRRFRERLFDDKLLMLAAGAYIFNALISFAPDSIRLSYLPQSATLLLFAVSASQLASLKIRWIALAAIVNAAIFVTIFGSSLLHPDHVNFPVLGTACVILILCGLLLHRQLNLNEEC